MASIAVLWRKCIETFKSILSSQSFGSEYEFLCTQLSVQWLRVRLWGESLGLQSQMGLQADDGVFDRPEVQATVNRCISNITYLLTEIEALRRKYEPKPRLDAVASEKSKDEGESSDRRRLTVSRPISSLRQRVKDNQKQKSFLAITKWAMGDAKTFGEKIQKVKVLIDGLEDVARAATFSRTPTLGSSRAIVVDNPPPYAEFEQGGRRSLQIPSITPLNGPSTTSARDASLSSQYHALKTFLAGLPASFEPARAQPRDKLTRLSDVQLKELRIDVYDDLIRRQHHPAIVTCLPPKASFHPKRNEARKKLSTLLPHRFRHLATDVMAELDRRFPHLGNTQSPSILANGSSPRPRNPSSQGPGNPLFSPSQPSRSLASRRIHRHECDGSPSTACDLGQLRIRKLQIPPRPPAPVLDSSRTTRQPTDKSLPPINENATPSQPAVISKQKEISSPSLISTFSTSANPTHPAHAPTSPRVELFKSFRVSMNDSCSRILPAALKKYNIIAAPEAYALYIVYGSVERLMKPDSKPLLEFKKLNKEGKKPMFMLRKVMPAGHERASISLGGPSVPTVL